MKPVAVFYINIFLDLIDTATLDLGLRKCSRYSFLNASKSLYADDVSILYAAIFQFIQNSEPVLGALVFSDMYRQNFLTLA